MTLLLLLSHFSRVRLCVTPETAAHQAPPSLGFSRQEHSSGLLLPSPMHESEKWKWSCSVVSDPVDYSLPGSSVHGIFQARVLEWGAIAMTPLVESICIKKKPPVSTKHTPTHLTTAPDLASYPSATPSSPFQDGCTSLLYSHVLERI